MSDNRTSAYAEAALAIARAEGNISEVEDELFRLARVVESNDDLRSTLTDAQLPVERRAQVVEDLLAGKVTATTRAFVSMVVVAGRAADLPAIADEVVRRSAEASGRAVAEVRSAVPLTEAQLTELAGALRARTGTEVTVRNVVDPTVIGGVVTRIGDAVIDGSLRTRLAQLRDAF
jgi:F-type H+-transporting ATPase subunit delta